MLPVTLLVTLPLRALCSTMLCVLFAMGGGGHWPPGLHEEHPPAGLCHLPSACGARGAGDAEVPVRVCSSAGCSHAGGLKGDVPASPSVCGADPTCGGYGRTSVADLQLHRGEEPGPGPALRPPCHQAWSCSTLTGTKLFP